MATDADAVAGRGKPGALAMAKSVTGMIPGAHAGRVSCAWSECGECTATGPRSQDDVPSCWPQPAVKRGGEVPSGTARSRMTESGTVPPCAHALMLHWAACPPVPLGWTAVTCRHRTRVSARLVLVVVGELLATGLPVAVAVAVGLALRCTVTLTSARGRSVVAVCTDCVAGGAGVAVEVPLCRALEGVGSGVEVAPLVAPGEALVV